MGLGSFLPPHSGPTSQKSLAVVNNFRCGLLYQSHQDFIVRRGAMCALLLRFLWGIALTIAIGIRTLPVCASSLASGLFVIIEESKRFPSCVVTY
jgi:hypothetical protein